MSTVAGAALPPHDNYLAVLTQHLVRSNEEVTNTLSRLTTDMMSQTRLFLDEGQKARMDFIKSTQATQQAYAQELGEMRELFKREMLETRQQMQDVMRDSRRQTAEILASSQKVVISISAAQQPAGTLALSYLYPMSLTLSVHVDLCLPLYLCINQFLYPLLSASIYLCCIVSILSIASFPPPRREHRRYTR